MSDDRPRSYFLKEIDHIFLAWFSGLADSNGIDIFHPNLVVSVTCVVGNVVAFPPPPYPNAPMIL
jgi:hypothetical protein